MDNEECEELYNYTPEPQNNDDDDDEIDEIISQCF